MKILFFAPHSAIWVHAFPEALVAESLMQAGHEVLYVGCGRQLDGYCIPVAAIGLAYPPAPAQRTSVCDRCERNEVLLRSQLRLAGPNLSDLLEVDDNTRANDIIANADGDLASIEIEGLKVGKIALYEFMLRKKLLTTTIIGELLAEFSKK